MATFTAFDYVHCHIVRDCTTPDAVLPVVGEYLLIDEGDAGAEYGGFVKSIDGFTVVLDRYDWEVDLGDVYWAVLVED